MTNPWQRMRGCRWNQNDHFIGSAHNMLTSASRISRMFTIKIIFSQGLYGSWCQDYLWNLCQPSTRRQNSLLKLFWCLRLEPVGLFIALTWLHVYSVQLQVVIANRSKAVCSGHFLIDTLCLSSVACESSSRTTHFQFVDFILLPYLWIHPHTAFPYIFCVVCMYYSYILRKKYLHF